MWDLPRPGLEPMSPALAGGFLTTAPPGKSYIILIVSVFLHFDIDVLIQPDVSVLLVTPTTKLHGRNG